MKTLEAEAKNLYSSIEKIENLLGSTIDDELLYADDDEILDENVQNVRNTIQNLHFAYCTLEYLISELSKEYDNLDNKNRVNGSPET